MATDLVVVDGHIDVPTRLFRDAVDLAVRHDTGHLDLPRLREGGADPGWVGCRRSSRDRRPLCVHAGEEVPPLSEDHAALYRPRRPRESPLFQLADFEDVKGRWEEVDCGVLDHGFARVSCSECRAKNLVAFSCQRRGFC